MAGDTQRLLRHWRDAVPDDADPWDEAIWKLANPALDDFRSLEDMRKENEEVEEMTIKEAELEELEKFGARLAMAYQLSGEPPSRAAIEYAEESVSLPERSPARPLGRAFRAERRQGPASSR